MASHSASYFTSADHMDWLWGTLKPWQILHSTLAQKERCGNVLDVWELVNETIMSASITTEEYPTRLKEEGVNGGPNTDGMRFLSDDLEYWKRGGVMEARVKEWLARRDEDQEKIDHVYPISALMVATDHECNLHLPHENHLIKRCTNRDQLAILQPSMIYLAAGKVAAHDVHVEHANYEFSERDESEGENDDEEEEQEEEEDDRIYNQNYIIADEDHCNGVRSSNDDENREEEMRRDIRMDHDHDHVWYSDMYRNHVIRENSLVVVNDQSSRINISAADADADRRQVVGDRSTAKMAGGLPDLEEGQNGRAAVCAVCLETLDIVGNSEEHYKEKLTVDVDYDEGSVQELTCRHAFHRGCISPWLQHHACCPCCRAPMLTTPTIAVNLEAPLNQPANLEAVPSSMNQQYTCADHAHDIMGLLADVEAALERLGLRS